MSTYFTRIDVNTRRRASVRLLSSPNFLHGGVLACFPPSQMPSRPLWRLDQTAAGTSLYLLSDVPPDPTGFVEEHGWPNSGGWETRDYEVVLGAVRDGAQFGFRLTANPTHSVMLPVRDGEPERTRGKRLAHVTAQQQLDWLAHRSSKWGFEVGSPESPTARIVERRSLRFQRRNGRVELGTATFEGTLRVTNAADMRQHMLRGFGPAKAYGCGLLTLAPAR